MRRRAIRLLIGTLLVFAAATATTAVQAKQLTDWGQAEKVPNVNDPVAADGCPIESPDGLSLYIASTRRGDPNDIWVATRDSEDADFGTPTMLPEPVNSDAADFCPTPLHGKYLLFVSARGGVDAYGTTACGGGDIYITRRSPATGDWAAPRNLGCAPNGPNGSGTEFGPSLVETDVGTLLYFSSGGPLGSNTQDIYVSAQLADGSFGAPTPVAELNTSSDDVMPNVSKDGLEIVFASTRPGGAGAFDVYGATRGSAGDPWSSPANLGPAVNTAAPETRPSLSWDGERLYFGRAGEIYVSERTKE
ncbi:MAG: hypothetical protein ACRDVN_13470 [Jiangellaceae bacterium]